MRHAMNRLRWPAVGVVLAALGALPGCNGWGGSRTGPVSPDAVAMLLPTKIRIHSFTKIKPLFGSALPNGIEVWLEPLDQFDDVVKVVGEFYFELYGFKPASADPKGERIEFWQVRIGTPEEQQRYWDRVARMYRFPLAWDYAPAPGRKYVLLVTYRTPSQERLADETTLTFKVDKGSIVESLLEKNKPQE